MSANAKFNVLRNISNIARSMQPEIFWQIVLFNEWVGY